MTDEFKYYSKLQELQSLRDPIYEDRVGISVLNQAQIWVEHQIEVWRGDFSDEENFELEEEKIEKEIVHLEDELTTIIECPG